MATSREDAEYSLSRIGRSDAGAAGCKTNLRDEGKLSSAPKRSRDRKRTVLPPIATAIASASRTLPLSVYCPLGRVSSLLQIPASEEGEVSD